MVDMINFSFNDRRIVHQKNLNRMRAERKTASTGWNKWVQIATLFLLFQWLEMAFRPVNADPIANSRSKRSHFHMAKAFTKPEIAPTPKPTGNFNFYFDY